MKRSTFIESKSETNQDFFDDNLIRKSTNTVIDDQQFEVFEEVKAPMDPTQENTFFDHLNEDNSMRQSFEYVKYVDGFEDE